MRPPPAARSRARIAAVIASAIVAIVATSVASPASATQSATPSGDVVDMRVPLERAVSVQDSMRLPLPDGASLAGLQFGVLGVVGEHYLADDRGRGFVGQFARDYGTDPIITGLILRVAASESGEPEVDLPEQVIVPQSMQTPRMPARLSGQIVDQAAESALQSSELLESSADSSSLAAAAASYWSPDFSEAGAYNFNRSGTTVARFYRYLSWNGGTHTPREPAPLSRTPELRR